MRVWIEELIGANPRLLLWKSDCFYCGNITDTDKAAWENRLRDAHDPAKVIGDGCQVAPIQLVTRVELDSCGEVCIYYGKTGMSVIKVQLLQGGQEVLDAVRGSRPDWRLDMRQETRGRRMKEGLAIIIFCAVFAVFFWGFYFGIEAGVIDRAHWLMALVVNNLGTLPLAICGSLCTLSTIAATVLVLVWIAMKPGQTQVLRPEA